jgi:hypothetical protein
MNEFTPDLERLPFLTQRDVEMAIHSCRNTMWNGVRQGKPQSAALQSELKWWEHQLEVLKEAQQAYDSKPN